MDSLRFVCLSLDDAVKSFNKNFFKLKDIFEHSKVTLDAIINNDIFKKICL